jgi:hypothetical protein
MANRKLAFTNCLLFLLAVSIIGCSTKPPPAPPVGSLKGKVLLDSKEVRMGFVVARPLDHNQSGTVRGLIMPDGQYEIQNIPSGPVRLMIELPPLPPEMDPKLRKTIPKDPKGGPPKNEKDKKDDNIERTPGEAAIKGMPEQELLLWQSVEKIPKVYFNPERSPLHTIVRPGEEPTEFDIRLSLKPPGPPDPSETPGGPQLPQPPPPPRGPH